MKSLPGWVAKGGAEGLPCGASPDGLGVCLEIADGAFRAIGPALASFLGRLGVETGGLGGAEVLNSRGERVGELRVVTREIDRDNRPQRRSTTLFPNAKAMYTIPRRRV